MDRTNRVTQAESHGQTFSNPDNRVAYMETSLESGKETAEWNTAWKLQKSTIIMARWTKKTIFHVFFFFDRQPPLQSNTVKSYHHSVLKTRASEVSSIVACGAFLSDW
jgi:hypothetical protein